jgi:hypothetical protein
VIPLPPWATVRVGATLVEIEAIVTARDDGATWAEAAAAAGLAPSPRKHGSWFGKTHAAMTAVIARLPPVALGRDGTGGIERLRAWSGADAGGVLVALRRWLFERDAVLFDPSGLLWYGRLPPRGPPSP